jgi:hypothetical protein
MPSCRLPRHLLGRPWRSRTGRRLHRALDAAADAGFDRDRDPGRAPVAGEISEMTNPRVLLMKVEIRTSERTGRPWYAGWLGRARVIGFEADDRGRRVIRFYIVATEPEPPRDGPPRPPAKPSGRDPTRGQGNALNPLAPVLRPRPAGVSARDTGATRSR